MKPRPIPDGFHTITPYLIVPNAAQFLEFLEKAFGATVLERVKRPDGTIGHAQARIGDSMLMCGQAYGDWKPEPASLYLYVEDCDAAYDRAIKAGSTSLMAITNQFYGDRQGGVRDPWGNTWWIATRIENVPQEELQRRADEAMKKRGA